MKKSIKLLDVVDKVGYKQGSKLKSSHVGSLIGKYFYPAYIKIFGMNEYNVPNKKIRTVDDFAAYLIGNDYPSKIETTILPDFMGGTIHFETNFHVLELAPNSFTVYFIFAKDMLYRRVSSKMRIIQMWILKFFLDFTPIRYVEFEAMRESMENWLVDLDEEDAIQSEKHLSRIEDEIEDSKRLIYELGADLFDVKEGKEHHDYLLSKSRHPLRKDYAKLIKKIIRFHKILNGKNIESGDYSEGSAFFDDIFGVAMTSDQILIEEHNTRLGECEDWSKIRIDICYDPKEDSYSLHETDYFNLKYAIKLYSEFVQIYYYNE